MKDIILNKIQNDSVKHVHKMKYRVGNFKPIMLKGFNDRKKFHFQACGLKNFSEAVLLQTIVC